jgi:tRNA dimethylallyltransferase
LRFLLSRLPLKTLQFILKTWDFNAYNTLNNSDLNNPYRLIRKIEICLSTGANQNINVPQYDLLHLSLTASNEYLYPRINQRVTDRLQLGHLNELKTLLARYPWSAPGLKVSAYACLRPYLERKESLATASFHWQAAEHRDARRQKTYFKKIPGARFVDISRPGWSKSVLTHVRKWYNQI